MRFLTDLQDVTDIIFTLVDEGGYFVHFDWLADGKSEIGLSTTEIESVLRNAGFSAVETRVAFDVTTAQGTQPVVVGIARKYSSIHRVRYSRYLYSGFIFSLFAIPLPT